MIPRRPIIGRNPEAGVDETLALLTVAVSRPETIRGRVAGSLAGWNSERHIYAIEAPGLTFKLQSSLAHLAPFPLEPIDGRMVPDAAERIGRHLLGLLETSVAHDTLPVVETPEWRRCEDDEALTLLAYCALRTPDALGDGDVCYEHGWDFQGRPSIDVAGQSPLADADLDGEALARIHPAPVRLSLTRTDGHIRWLASHPKTRNACFRRADPDPLALIGRIREIGDVLPCPNPRSGP